MSNSSMPNLPGFGAIAESMELGRKLWGSTGWAATGAPGITTPMLSPEEIDKQIADLKAVEAWLTLNMNMLRGTIQALEVQSATISALKSMGEAFKNATVPVAAASPATGFSFPFAAPAQESSTNPSVEGNIAASMTDPTAWWNMLQSQFKQAMNAAAVTTPHAPADASTQSPLAAEPLKPHDDASSSNVHATSPAAPASQAVGKADRSIAKGAPDTDQRPTSAAENLNATSTSSPSANSKRIAKDIAKPPSP